MTQKVNITVPDELYEKMKKWKKDFNFSGIFQKAVAEAIERKESFRKRLEADEDMEQVIERLREEKMKYEGDFYSMGQEEGMRWVRAASYEDLLDAAEWVLSTPPDKHLADYLDEEISTDHRMTWDGTNPHSANEPAFEFIQGWKAAVDRFWEEIEDKL